MPSREVLRRHADLLDRMATKLGVDLQSVAIAGDVSVDEISEAVLRCSGCPDPEHCAFRLRLQETSAEPPEYCRNRELLQGLMPSAGPSR
ncbi:conserved hypothetical protein [Ruegeria lacuscaerulensis ITI-1157]|nr:conserved hypothetical protein [Ruegeria lacuscaerulensis ITI-1157]SHI91378.1 hypothetical protein SAMN05444404_0986 [Ruegeria lacuscaerulensis ITI-1157]